MTPHVLANELLTTDATHVAELLIKQEVTWNSDFISDSDRDIKFVGHFGGLYGELGPELKYLVLAIHE